MEEKTMAKNRKENYDKEIRDIEVKELNEILGIDDDLTYEKEIYAEYKRTLEF
jgi:hypothetical protein